MVDTTVRRDDKGGDGVDPRPVATTRGSDAMRAPVGAMTVDVEEHFQVYALSERIARTDWDALETRVQANTERILALFARHRVKGTFFTLGWVAERNRDLVRRIVAEGHELASHGYAHVPVHQQSPEAFRADVGRTKRLLEDLAGAPVAGYRAASFSVRRQTPWVHRVLAEEGYAYSSSVYPIVHDHYGLPDASPDPHHPDKDGVLEIPVATTRLVGRTWPCGGGGYFRLLPYGLNRWALTRAGEREGRRNVFYFHPWEIDPGQPRVSGLSRRARFRHYTNLDRMEGRLDKLLREFSWDRMDRVFDL
jgi:polysaccharide deacetylase family protein (PEP-CTERM system associated)